MHLLRGNYTYLMSSAYVLCPIVTVCVWVCYWLQTPVRPFLFLVEILPIYYAGVQWNEMFLMEKRNELQMLFTRYNCEPYNTRPNHYSLLHNNQKLMYRTKRSVRSKVSTSVLSTIEVCKWNFDWSFYPFWCVFNFNGKQVRKGMFWLEDFKDKRENAIKSDGQKS